MILNELLKTVTARKKTLGRGQGSGRGKTSGRGTKGLKARGKVRLGFIGGSLPLYRKLPLKRGYHNTVLAERSHPVNLSALSVFKAGFVVDLESLFNNHIVTKRDLKKGVKILGLGEITHALTIRVPVSKAAQQKIITSGGKVENV